MSPFLLPALAALAWWPTPPPTVDLAKIDRTIRHEPAYRSKAPRYCLLVFGPEARTRVWLVLDGDTVYLDRNGNGQWQEDNRQYEKHYYGYHYQPPPVVYATPYNYGYQPPPVYYDNTPAISIRLF